MTDQTLTVRQHRALDRLAVTDPFARVIGWIVHRDRFMPVIDAPGLTAILAVDRRGAMKSPNGYFTTGYTVASNFTYEYDPQSETYGLRRNCDYRV